MAAPRRVSDVSYPLSFGKKIYLLVVIKYANKVMIMIMMMIMDVPGGSGLVALACLQEAKGCKPRVPRLQVYIHLGK